MEKDLQFRNQSMASGFTQMPNAVLKSPKLTMQAKTLYAQILSYGWGGSIFPGRERLAEENDVHINTIDKHMKELKDLGLITVQQRGLGKTNLYVIEDASVILDSQYSVSLEPHQSVNKEYEVEKDKVIEYEELPKKIPFAEIISYLNEKTGRRFRNVAANQKFIKARWNEGYRLDDFKAVIDKKVGHWKGDPEMDCHLKPETLFGNKFDKYMNEPLQNPFKKRQAYQTPQPSPQNVAPPDIDPEVLQRIKNLSGVKTNGS